MSNKIIGKKWPVMVKLKGVNDAVKDSVYAERDDARSRVVEIMDHVENGAKTIMLKEGSEFVFTSKIDRVWVSDEVAITEDGNHYPGLFAAAVDDIEEQNDEIAEREVLIDDICPNCGSKMDMPEKICTTCDLGLVFDVPIEKEEQPIQIHSFDKEPEEVVETEEEPAEITELAKAAWPGNETEPLEVENVIEQAPEPEEITQSSGMRQKW